MSGPSFIACDTPDLEYRHGEKVVNCPVNLAMVATFKKSKYRWYPDNKGLPGIQFYSIEKKEIAHWAYKDETVRDDQYVKIINTSYDL